MAKRGHTVRPPKDKGNGKSIHVGTITTDQLTQMRKKKEREERLASGVKQTGAGAHGGDKRTRNKRERKQSRLATTGY
jgi:hypothetical protein